jgi:putative ABC transport system permease protein
MLLWTIIESGLKSLWANKLRSLLAMLGIIIGVMAVIAMLAIGAGAQKQITSRFEAMGTNLLFVRPAQKAAGGGAARTGSYENLVVEDALAIAQLPGVAAVSPVVNGSVQAKYMNQNTRTSVNGVSMPYFQIRNFELDKGRPFTEGEAEGMARVAVIGPNVAANLFGKDDPIGQTVKFNNINFTIVGVLKSKGDQGWNNPDDQALVPYTTAMKIMFGLDYLREVDIQIADGFDQGVVSGQPKQQGGGFGPPGRGGTMHQEPPAADSVTGLLRKRHRLTDLSMPDDFQIQNQAELLANLSSSIMVFRVLLGGIAAISLLVGGIGIMNIMLVTVTERTREIGTRKAIGATSMDIMLQFLVESMVMCGIGGSIGAGLGILIAFGIEKVPIPNGQPFTTQVEPAVVIGSIIVATVVGLGSGLYPAFRASLLDPIEALRYE